MRISAGPQGQKKKEVDALPFVERRARSRPRFLFLQFTKQSLHLRQWISGRWIINPNMGKLDRQGSTPQFAHASHAQEDKSRPFSLTRREDSSTCSESQLGCPDRPAARGTCRQRRRRRLAQHWRWDDTTWRLVVPVSQVPIDPLARHDLAWWCNYQQKLHRLPSNLGNNGKQS